jgi:2-(1,2-epoxy-1,2-dihydrophenyl)acetyl-CoA isomerase
MFDQMDCIVRQANPVPDVTALDSISSPVLLLDEQGRMEMQTREKVIVDPRPPKRRRGWVLAVPAVVAIAVVGVLLIATRGSNETLVPADDPVTTTQVALIDSVPAPESVAMAFLEARTAGDFVSAASYLGDDATIDVGPGDSPETLGFEMAWQRATGLVVTFDECTSIGESVAGAAATFTVAPHASLRSPLICGASTHRSTRPSAPPAEPTRIARSERSRGIRLGNGASTVYLQWPTEMSMDQIVTTTAYGVATIRLNDPASMNALSVPIAAELERVIAELSEDRTIRALVLTGTGRAFCAGGDVQSFYDNRDDPAEVMQAVLDGLHGAVGRLIDAPFPTIAAINGVVAGAGMGIALATDLAIAAESAMFTMAYTGIGVSPDGSSTFFLPRLVGTRVAMDMILTNRRVSSEEALSLGIINTVVPDDELEETAKNLATKLAAGPTLAYVRARKLIRSSMGADPFTQMDAEAEGILAAGDTQDFYEGISAFIEKRPPTFTGT